LQLSQKYERWCGWSNFDEDGNIIETETIERVKPVLEVLEDEVSEEDDDEDETEEDETWCRTNRMTKTNQKIEIQE
jgi:hypothetical protein